MREHINSDFLKSCPCLKYIVFAPRWNIIYSNIVEINHYLQSTQLNMKSWYLVSEMQLKWYQKPLFNPWQLPRCFEYIILQPASIISCTASTLSLLQISRYHLNPRLPFNEILNQPMVVTVSNSLQNVAR